jgi:hypothetical protein
MSVLGKKPQCAPELSDIEQVPEGRVFVQGDKGIASQLTELENGKKAVLCTEGGGRLELITMSECEGVTDQEYGTFLNDADYKALKDDRAKPALRAYLWTDTLGKVFSKKGAVLVLTTVLGLLVAAFGVYIAIWGKSGTSPAAVAERGEALVRWVAEPASGPTAVRVRTREAQAERCLISLRGGEASVSSVGGVKCTADSPPLWQDKDVAAAIATIVGAITALLSGLLAAAKFGFQHVPE